MMWEEGFEEAGRRWCGWSIVGVVEGLIKEGEGKKGREGRALSQRS